MISLRNLKLHSKTKRGAYLDKKFIVPQVVWHVGDGLLN